MMCDNRSVVTVSIVPTSVLNKRRNAICYHRVREAQDAGAIRVGSVPLLPDDSTFLRSNTYHTRVLSLSHSVIADGIVSFIQHRR